MAQVILTMKMVLPTKLLATALFLGCGSLSAAIVQYSTTGAFSTSGTNTTIVDGGIQLTFVPAVGNVNANPTTIVGLGNVIISVPAGTVSPLTIPPGLTLAINILQSAPTVGMGTLTGSITGTVSVNSSTATITPILGGTAVIGNITYTLLNNFLAAPNSNGGNTSIQGIITDRVVPEPGTLSLLFGGALLAIGNAKTLKKRFVS